MASKSLSRVGRICQHPQPCPQFTSATPITLPIRIFSTTAKNADSETAPSTDSSAAPQPPPPPPTESTTSVPLTPKQHALLTPADPNTSSTRRLERILQRQGTPPIGSRRRRAAQHPDNIPFEQLPYQCFQEARKVLLEDRSEKLSQIACQRARIERLKFQDVGSSRSSLVLKEKRLWSMLERLERLKILADINDPLVRKRFEDGDGDMAKPVYRHLALQKCKAQRHLILKQRLEQMHVYPDVLPPFEVAYDMHLNFGRKNVQPGEFVHSALSERPPKLVVQPFDRGERLVTVAVMDPDVPDVENDAYTRRCHFLAMNVPLGPANTRVAFEELMGTTEMAQKKDGEEGYDSKEGEASVTQETRKIGDCLLPWLPPYAQKGSPYHRLAVIVLQQPKQLDMDKLQKADGKYAFPRERVSVTAMMARFHLRPKGGFIFRTQWDTGMDALMGRMGVDGVGEELKRKKVEPLPYKWKPSMSERYR